MPFLSKQRAAASRLKTRWLAGSMVLAVVAVSALAAWSEEREARLALAEFASAQVAVAEGVAAGLVQANGSLRGNPSAVARGLAILAKPGEREVLIYYRGAFLSSLGSTVDLPELQRGWARGETQVPVGQAEAARLGLGARSAWAGLAWASTASGDRIGVAVIASARHDRDRARRAAVRLLSSIALAAGLVLVFGSLALRERSREIDSSRRLALEQLSREREEKLERAKRAATVITLASGIAHELGTPLSVIVGRAEQLLGRASDDRSLKSAQQILDQAERIRQVLKGFLGLARGAPPALAEVSAQEVVRAAQSLVEHRFAHAQVSLAVQPCEPSVRVRCDRLLLEHAMVNLLLNACDACSAHGRVELAVIRNAESVSFVVDDDGHGIPETVAARAMEPFFTTKSPGAGTGLGLALATEIAKVHAGSLSLQVRAPRGTSARLTLPLPPEVSRG